MGGEKPRVSLCIIARDEEENLSRCLGSAAGAVDEVVVVDTGSRDGTAAVARRFGARVCQLPWPGNFSAARNYALDQATGEWVLVLDADDELPPETQAAIPALVRDAGPDLAGYAFTVASWLGAQPGGHLMLVTQPRLWRNRPEHRYEGAIHEWPRLGPVAYTGLRIYHYGCLDRPRAQWAKFRRNLPLLLAQLAQEPDRAYWHYQLGAEYLRVRRPRRALPHLWRAWRLEPCALYADQLAAALVRVGHLRQARVLLEEAAGRWPDYTDLTYRLGCVRLLQGDPSGARAAFRRCLELGPAPPAYPSLEGCGSYLAWFQLGQAEWDLGNFAAAAAAFWEAIAARPNFSLPAGWLVRAWVAAYGPAAAVDLWRSRVAAPPAVTAAAARQLLAWGCPAAAAALVEGLAGPEAAAVRAEVERRAGRGGPDAAALPDRLGGESPPPAVQARVGRSLLREGYPGEAARWLGQALATWGRRPGRRALLAAYGTALLELDALAAAARHLRAALAKPGGGTSLPDHLALVEAILGAAGRADLRAAVRHLRRRWEPMPGGEGWAGGRAAQPVHDCQG